MFKDKYSLTKEQNIFLAKKLIAENIYHSARLEGCNVTFPDTKTILDGVSVANMKMNDVECILNLRDAWKYLLSTVEKPFNLDYACKVNEFVARNESLEWGVLRTGKVGIGGTDYKPEIPVKENVVEQINKIMALENTTEKAIKYFLWGCRSQLFWDGNKRTSTLCANKILIAEGKGILSIKENDLGEFNKRLVSFYDSNDYSLIDQFIYDNCIIGIEF
ncbi:Fic family protein [Acetivibrio cellulolyticus]|uniref:Fic family protein n=1 Tax=Acetivibrio cellulolyticus TaxID=35830 RepID=UPI0001E2C788|nr:Fic family protein [Acetivibrio cellulolyticus]